MDNKRLDEESRRLKVGMANKSSNLVCATEFHCVSLCLL